MTAADRQRVDVALDWVRRIHDPDFEDWMSHMAWLEADPRNVDAFDDAGLMIDIATKDLAAPRHRVASQPPTNDNAAGPVGAQRRRSRWGVGIGLAIAASLVSMIAVPSIMRGGSQTYLLQTGAGEQRSMVLPDGTTIALNGNSQIQLDHGNARIAVLERGEAFFTVKHDAAHPFAVMAGNARFQDVGTAFDVIHQNGATLVAVRDGAVMYDPDDGAVRLDGGQSIRISDKTATVEMVDKSAVGGWRSGRLSYRDAPLAEVAGDIARSIGEPVKVDRALEQRRFSGVVIIDADRPLMFRRMATAMGVEIRRAPQAGWMLMPPR